MAKEQLLSPNTVIWGDSPFDNRFAHDWIFEVVASKGNSPADFCDMFASIRGRSQKSKLTRFAIGEAIAIARGHGACDDRCGPLIRWILQHEGRLDFQESDLAHITLSLEKLATSLRQSDVGSFFVQNMTRGIHDLARRLGESPRKPKRNAIQFRSLVSILKKSPLTNILSSPKSPALTTFGLNMDCAHQITRFYGIEDVHFVVEDERLFEQSIVPLRLVLRSAANTLESLQISCPVVGMRPPSPIPFLVQDIAKLPKLRELLVSSMAVTDGDVRSLTKNTDQLRLLRVSRSLITEKAREYYKGLKT